MFTCFSLMMNVRMYNRSLYTLQNVFFTDDVGMSVQQVSLQTEMGQLLDMTTESPEGILDFSRFTMKVCMCLILLCRPKNLQE